MRWVTRASWGGSIVLLLCLGHAPDAQAVTTVSKADGDWDNTNTWTNGVPVAGDEARINGGYDVTIASGQPAAAARVVVGRLNNADNRLNINDDLTIRKAGIPYDGRLILALSNSSNIGKGTVTQSGANTVVDVEELISFSQANNAATGEYYLNGGELRVGTFIASTMGYGQLHISTVGNTSGSDPQVHSPITFTDPTGTHDITADNFRIGKDANGNFIQEDGTVTVESHLPIGLDGHTGTYVLNTGTLNVITDGQNTAGAGLTGTGLGKLSLGVRGGSGTFQQNGGTVNIDNDLRLGVESGNNSSGVYYLDGGILNVGVDVNLGGNSSIPNGEIANQIGYAELNIGTTGNPLRFGSGAAGDITLDAMRVAYWNGGGDFTQSKGTVEIGSTMMVGGGGHTGTYNMNGGSLNVTTAGQPDAASSPGSGHGDFYVSGWGGTGTFNQNGAGTSVNVENNLIIGGSTSNSNSGLYQLKAGTLDVGGAITNEGGYSEMNITGGTLVVGSPGPNGGSTGDIHLDKLRVSFNDGNGQFVQDGGNVVIDSFLAVGVVRKTGTYTMHGGSLQLTTAGQPLPGKPVGTGSGLLAVGVNGGTGTFTQNDGTVTIEEELDLASNVNVTSTPSNGTYELAGGLLDLTGGRIEADATAVADSQANFSFIGGTLRDVSVFDISTANHPRDFVNDGGTLQPGPVDAGGRMNIVGDYIENAGTLEIDLFGIGDFDSLDVDGTVSLGSTLVVNLDPGYTPQICDSFLILDNDGTGDPITGTFSGLPEGSEVWPVGYPHETFLITYVGGDGNDVMLTRVPEPATLGLLALGVVWLLGYARRKSAKFGLC